MSNLIQLLQENQKLKYQLEKLKSSNGLLPYIDDSVIKGGYHVVKNIVERDNIDCCHRKLGMKVLVIGEDFSFKEYVLKSNNCKENIWQKRNTITEEDDVTLVEDYSELEENLTTQKELNLILKNLILNLQNQIDNIELIDEKVQITEDTPFANIGQSQKDFNKNISDKFNETDNLFLNYYTKNETYSQTEINGFLSGKQNTIGYTPENSANKSNSYTISSSVTYASTKALVDGLSTKLDKGTYSGKAQDLKNEIDTKQKKLSSFDESILIETDGNIEGNVSLFTEYFQQQVCELNFIPIQIIGVYQDGIKLLPEEFNITLPKTITITTYSTEKIEIQYTKLKI